MAPRTKIGIIYDIYTGYVRRIIAPGDHGSYSEDQQLATHAKTCGFDEKMVIENYSGPITPEAINSIVQRHTGKMLT